MKSTVCFGEFFQEHSRIDRAPQRPPEFTMSAMVDLMFSYIRRQAAAATSVRRLAIRLVEALVHVVIVGEDAGVSVAQRHHSLRPVSVAASTR